ncbi:MAG: hypothetical protein E6K94_04675 [Thaumarchaeota archaeon]|nr:MAG: hypothetical protein E6K94_04675 [Nitrososphaerota archaeon]
MTYNQINVSNLVNFASPLGRKGNNHLGHDISLIVCLIIISTSIFLQSLYVYGQSDPFSSSKTCTKLPVNGITASGAENLHPPSHAIDQNLNTRWSNLGLGSWIQIDLGQDNAICSVGINWHRGNERTNTFVISVSQDGKTFTKTFSGKSDGTSLNEQNYNLQSKTGRFIRVIVNGNTQSDWVSISELKIYGYKSFSESCVRSSVSLATAGASQAGFPPSNVLDNNLNTVWSNYGVGSWIQLDLGTSKNICSIDIAWYKGNERQNNFVISTSLDGKSYTTVLSTKSSGNTFSYENYEFPDTVARYIKITVNGNTKNNYGTIYEIRALTSSSDQSQNQCAATTIENVKTSGSQDGFPTSNVLDNNLNTRWSNIGVGSWIQLDLGTSKNICSIDIAWYKGNERQNNFVISASNDGIKFSNILSSKSSGSTLSSEKYNIHDNNARYLRVTVNGNTQNNYASITELDVFSLLPNSPPVANDQVLTTNLNTQLSVTLKATDPDNDFLTYSIVSQPSHGTISGGNGASRIYTPSSGYSGPDNFIFKVNDSKLYSNTATVSINVVSISSNYYIGAAGDWGSARNDNWKKTVQVMINNKVNLALGLGDYSYGSVNEFQPVIETLRGAGIPFKGVQGNHDTSSYAKLFGQPSMLFALDAGQARIILLNTEDSVSSNALFLENELKTTKQPWKIVVLHKPLYTSPSTHPEEKELANKLQPLFDKYGVDLVVYGHNHNYERIKLPDKPTIFIQAGTGGESHYAIKGERSGGGVLYQNDNDFGILKIAINSNTLSGQFISHAGKILDSFSMSK